MKINKRGQFYFIGALMLVLVIVSFVTMNNYVLKKENSEMKNIQEELNIEIQRTLEYIVSGNLSDSEALVLFANFSSHYINKTGKNKNIVFMFGKKNGNLILKGNKVADSENMIIMTGDSTINIEEDFVEGIFEKTILSGTDITLTSGTNNYSFDLYEGQNFYYFITKEYKGEKQIILG